jgi:hypothetical protein
VGGASKHCLVPGPLVQHPHALPNGQPNARPVLDRTFEYGEEMKPGGDPRLLRLTIGGSFDGTLGSDPEHQDRSHRWLGSLIIDSAPALAMPDSIEEQRKTSPTPRSAISTR